MAALEESSSNIQIYKVKPLSEYPKEKHIKISSNGVIVTGILGLTEHGNYNVCFSYISDDRLHTFIVLKKKKLHLQ